jgi:hypothetical protein
MYTKGNARNTGSPIAWSVVATNLRLVTVRYKLLTDDERESLPADAWEPVAHVE